MIFCTAWRIHFFGFAKSERSSVSDKELEMLKRLAPRLLSYDARSSMGR